MSPFRACRVSFIERGIEQVANVDAESAFEACALALKFWSTRRFVKGPRRDTKLTVEVNSPARLLVEVKVAQVFEWLYVKPAANVTQRARIERLRGLLADDRH